ncbi:MAG: polymer-forming cytoskeletal protein [Armatimonadetes bacterium]|nr:polymer-forming cytoskeletal protein [Armatimonadota bacterium]
MRALHLACLAAILALARPPIAGAAPEERRPRQDVLRVGPDLTLTTPTQGDVLAAAGRLEVHAPVRGSMVAIGGEVRSGARIGNDLVTAGGTINVDAPVGSTLAAAGGRISVAPAATIGGDAYLAGGEVRLQGRVNGDLRAGAGRFELAAPVRGDMEVHAGEVVLRPGAVVQGNLTVYAPRPAQIDAGAVVRGRTTYVPTAPTPQARVFGWVVHLLMLLATGFLILALSRQWPTSVAETLQQQAAMTALLGLAVLVLAPLAAILLIVTVVGLPMALIVIGFYLAALYVAPIFAVFGLARWALARWQGAPPALWLAMLLGVVAYAVATEIPVVGWLMWLAALLAGLGALVLERWRARQVPARAPVAVPPASA